MRLLSFFRSEQTLYKIMLSAGLLLGVIARLVQYLSNQSLWLDEAALASSIVNRSYAGLLENPDYHQIAPIGFLFVERFFVSLFGKSGLVLHIFPLLCGLASVFLFYHLCKVITDRLAICIGVVLFSGSYYLIYYSAELKQYSTDVMAAVLCLLFCLYFIKNKISFRFIAAMTLSAVLCVYLSQPTVFVLSGISAGLLIHVLKKANRSKIRGYLFFCFFWGIAFLLNYVFFLSKWEQYEPVFQYWSDKNAFLRLGGIGPFLFWFPDTALRVLAHPCTFTNQALATPFLCAGLYYLYKHHKEMLAVFAFIILSAVAASAFKLFPFSERVILFIVPMVFLVYAAGVSQLLKFAWPQHKPVTLVLLFLVAWPPMVKAVRMTLSPEIREDVKSLFAYIEQEGKDGDVVYLYPAFRKTYPFYKDNYDFSRFDRVVLGDRKKTPDEYVDVANEYMKYPRVWFLFTHVSKNIDYDDRQLILMHLNQRGRLIDRYEPHRAWLYLYEFPEKDE